MRKQYTGDCQRCGNTFSSIFAKARYCSKPCWYLSRYDPEVGAERFLSKVSKTDSCWLWTWQLDRRGYGVFNFSKKKWAAHRYSWAMVHGPIPTGLEVCHNCPGGDNRACVNPDHLFLGTHLENMQDAVAKGRTVRGSRAWNSTLKESDVPIIRQMFASGMLRVEIAKQFNVSLGVIAYLIRGKTWKYVA